MTISRLGFIGAGRMASAMARGLVRAGLFDASSLWASDPYPAPLEQFVRDCGGRPANGNRQVVESCDAIVLAVKPQQVAGVLAELRGHVHEKHLFISIAAGITLNTLSQGLGSQGLGAGPRLVRVMPNTPCLIGQGASAYSLGPGATEQDAAFTARLLGAVGIARQVDEKLLDAVTGLSGSGPAFVCVMIEALADGGVLAGLPRQIALELAAQTLKGTAEMVLATGEHPAALRDAVASPGGTTIAGLRALEAGGVRGALIEAVEAAARRSQELGRMA